MQPGNLVISLRTGKQLRLPAPVKLHDTSIFLLIFFLAIFVSFGFKATAIIFVRVSQQIVFIVTSVVDCEFFHISGGPSLKLQIKRSILCEFTSKIFR